MEDKAQENIERLVDLGMVEEVRIWDSFSVPSSYCELSLSVMKAEDFFISTTNLDSVIMSPMARHVSILGAENTITNRNSLLHSLFVSEKGGLSEASSDCLRTVLHNAKLLRVLALENTKLRNLLDEVGQLVNLK